MDRNEFRRWLSAHMGRLPSVGHWLAELPDEAKAAQVAQWEEDLLEVSADDAAEVSRRMHSGALDPPPKWDMERTGMFVRRAAERIAAGRNRQKAPQHRPRRARGLKCDQGAISLREAAQRVSRLLESGRSIDEARTEIGLMPSDSPDEWPRYRCHLCRDTGTVEVWGIRSYHAARDGTLDDPRERVVCTAPCSCHEGGRFVRPQRDETGRIPRYDPDWHCLAPLGDVHSAKAIAAFRAWFDRFLERRAPPKEPAFTAFNEGRGW